MLLKNFVEQNRLKVDSKYLDLAEEGFRIMKRSRDIRHDHEHVAEIIQLLEKFVKNEKSVNHKEIDFDVLLPSICWHDVWLTYRDQVNSIKSLILERTYEGLGSSKLFKKHLEKKRDDFPKAGDISMIISLHADYKFLPFLKIAKLFYRNIELKILTDLDTISALSINRIKRIKKRYMKKHSTDPLLFRVAFFYVTKVMIKQSSNSLDYDFSKKMYDQKRQEFFRVIYDILDSLLQNKEYYFDTSHPGYSYIRNFNVDMDEIKLQMGI